MARFYEKNGQTVHSQKCPRSLCVGSALRKMLVFLMQISRKTFVWAFQRYIVHLHRTKTSYHIHALLIRPYFCDLWVFRPSWERAISQPPFLERTVLHVGVATLIQGAWNHPEASSEYGDNNTKTNADSGRSFFTAVIFTHRDDIIFLLCLRISNIYQFITKREQYSLSKLPQS